MFLGALGVMGCNQKPTPPSAPSACASALEPLKAPLPVGATEVDIAWVSENRCSLRVIDVREPDELTGPVGVIPGATSIPLGQLADRVQTLDRNEPVVLVCRSGGRSAKAQRMLSDLGFSRAVSMRGGMLAWRAANLPVAR